MSASPGPTSNPGTNQVEHLNDVEDQGDAGHHQHENDKDGLLCGSGHVALHGEGTGLLRTGEHGDHDEAVQVVLAYDEGGLNDDLEYELGQVAPQQIPLDLHLSLLVCVFRLLAPLVPTGARQTLPQLCLLVDDVHGVAQIDQGWCGDKDNLEDPEANVRDGESPVVADVFATRLLSVAGEIRLLVTPDTLGTRTQNHDPEQEQDRHPDLPDDRRVGLDLVQQF